MNDLWCIVYSSLRIGDGVILSPKVHSGSGICRTVHPDGAVPDLLLPLHPRHSRAAALQGDGGRAVRADHRRRCHFRPRHRCLGDD